MANIIKRAIRIFNGKEWDKYHPETSADQVVYTKPDGTASNVQKELAEQNSTYAITGVDLGGNAGVSLKCFYNTYICEVRIEGKTTEAFPNWGGYRLGILPEKARPKQNIVEYLYESFFLEIGTDGVVNLKVSGQMPSGTSVWGSKMFFIK